MPNTLTSYKMSGPWFM